MTTPDNEMDGLFSAVEAEVAAERFVTNLEVIHDQMRVVLDVADRLSRHVIVRATHLDQTARGRLAEQVFSDFWYHALSMAWPIQSYRDLVGE